MIIEAVDIVAKWLQDPTYGVNQFIAGVPRSYGRDPPPNVNVYSENDNDEVARGKFPIEQDPSIYPMIIVSRPETIGIVTAVRTSRWDGSVSIVIGYAQRDIATAAAICDVGYTLRAVLRSLWALEDPSNAAGEAARHPAGTDIAMRGFDDRWELVGVQAPFESKQVIGGLVMRVTMIDTKPGG